MSELIPPNPPSSPQNPTSIETVAQRLSPPQFVALNAIITGSTIKVAAKAAGVHRSTLHRWMTRDANFRAAFNAYQHEAKDSTKVKLLATVDDAVITVTEAIKGGDERMAYALLKDLGLLSKLNPGATDPELLSREILVEHSRRRLMLDNQAEQLGIKDESTS